MIAEAREPHVTKGRSDDFNGTTSLIWNARRVDTLAGGSRARRPRRWLVRVCGPLDRGVLPSVVCEPATPARSRRVFRFGGRCRARRIQGLSPLSSQRAGAARPVDREDPPGVRVPRERRGPSFACDAGGAAGRQPVPHAAQLQADRRPDAPRVRRGVPPAEGEAAAERGRRCHDGRHRRRVRIEQPFLRTRGAQIGDVAINLSKRRSGHEHSLHDRRFAAGTPSGRRDPARRVRGGDGGGGCRVGARLGQRVPGRHDRGRRRRARKVDDTNSRPSGWTAAPARSPSRRSSDVVSMAGLEGARRDSVRRNAIVRRRGQGDRPANGGPRRGARVRDQSRRARHPVSPRRADG